MQYSAELYAALEAETGLATGYRNVGGVIVARTEDRMVQLRRTAANAAAYDLDCELISAERAQELWPPMQVDDLLGAIWLPGDGKVNPTDLTQSLAKGARLGGATIAEQVRVTGFDVDDGGRPPGHRACAPTSGDVEARSSSTAPASGRKALGDLVGVTVPLHSAEHFYVVTEAVEGTHPDLPIMRDPDGWTYFKEEVGGLVVGGFEPEAKPWRSPDDLPHPFEFQLLEEDWEHFSVLMDEALHRVPALAETGIRKFYNGPESFTPDNQFLLGRGARGSTASSSAPASTRSGIASAGGAGRALAEWIVGGRADRRTWSASTSAGSRRSTRDNALAAGPGRGGARPALRRPVAEPRGRAPPATCGCSPVHDRLAAAGAVFGSKMGWERAERLRAVAGAAELDYAWGKPSWLPWSAAEQRATRTGGRGLRPDVVLQVRRRRARRARRRCSGSARPTSTSPVGRSVYTPFLNERGTYEADLTVTRTGDGRSCSSPARPPRSATWTGCAGTRGLDGARDVTGDYAVLGVMGPRVAGPARAGSPTRRPVGGRLPVRDQPARSTLAGVDGAGDPDDLRRRARLGADGAGRRRRRRCTTAARRGAAARSNAGYYAIESLRLEKGYRAFGRELTPDYTPGRGRAWSSPPR